MKEENMATPSAQDAVNLGADTLEGVTGGMNMPNFWTTCPKCGAENAYSLATMKCNACGYNGASKLVSVCPKCGSKAYLEATGHCYSCGYNA